MKCKLLFITLAVAALGINRGSAQVLFSEDFDSDHSANWDAKLSGSDAVADFFFDYSTIGIPAAPNSVGGSTRGARFLVNQSAGVQQGISATPIGGNFTGNYRVSFDMWLNFNGPLDLGGNGSTQIGSFGIGTSGTTAQWAGSSSSLMFGASGDGGTIYDYRVYANNALQGPASGYYAAGTDSEARNNIHSYYTSKFGGEEAPAAQLSLYPGQNGATAAGTAGFAWRNVVIEKIGNTATWKLDGHLIATVPTGSLTLSSNIFIGMFDINAGSSSDPEDHLLTAIYDNIRVEAITGAVGVTASTSTANEGGANGVFTFTRTGDTSSALTVFFTLSGTAVNGSDYNTISGSVTIPSGQLSTTLNVTPIDDSTAEVAETVILTLTSDASYEIGDASATVTIIDNEAPAIQISALQDQLLEGYAFSTAKFRLTRVGSLSGSLTVNITYSGSATHNTDFSGNTTVVMGDNVSTADLTVSTIGDTSYEGNETITGNVASGSGYSIGTPSSANITIIDDEYPAGTVLFEDNFNNAITSESTWTVNALDDDSTATFGWDYSANAGIPAAPRSSGSTLGVRMTANETFGAVNGISISPAGYNFTGDYRLSFDMWVNYNGRLNGGGAGSTEGFNAGIGTTGDHANWPSGFSDGAWFSVIGDAGNGNASGDYNAYYEFNLVSETTGAYAAGTDVSAREHNNAFYSIWGGNGAPAAQIALAPAQTNNTPIGCIGIAWHTVTINKKGEVVTWTIDGVTVATLTNSVDTPFTTTGTIFIGYHDPYASLSGDPTMSFAVVDNLRVETLVDAPPAAPVIGFSRSGDNVTLTWTGSFTLQQASALTGSPSDWVDVGGATSGHVVDASSGIKFYRLRQ